MMYKQKLINFFFFYFFCFFLYCSENIYLIDFAYVKVNPNYTKETFIHQKIKIGNEKGKKFSHLQIPFNSEREKIKFIEGQTLLPNGKKIKIKPDDIKIVTPAEFTEYSSLYPGYKVMSINFPGVEIGCIIEYKYIIYTFKPLIEKHFWDGFYFQSTEEFALSRYELKIPKKIKLQIYEKDIKLLEKKESFDYITYIWEKKNVPSIIEEILMPPLSEIVPKVYVSTFSSWEEIGKWFFELIREDKNKEKEVEKFVEQIVKDRKTEEEKIISIYNYVCSNIRYVGLEMGIHGYKPHSPEEVLKAKYGDCKDKANLLRKMLEVVGIKSFITLVNTERKVEKEIPFPGQFNHAIIAVLKDNSYIFLDPTLEVMRYPDIPNYLQGKYSLICSETPELKEISISKPERNLRKRIVDAIIDEDGNLTAEVKILPCGIFEASLRNSFRYLKQVERERQLVKELNSILPRTRLIYLELEGLESLENQLIEKYKFLTNNYGIKVGNKIIFQPILLDKLTDLSIVSLDERKYPLRLNLIYRKEEIVNYKLPEKTEIEALPNSINIEQNFGKFYLDFQKIDSGLKCTRILEINKLEINPNEYQEFKEFYKKISYLDKLPIILNIKEK